MKRRIPVSVIFIVGLILAFFLDGSISQAFASVLYAEPNSMVPYLTLMWLCMTAFFSTRIKRLHVGIWAAIIGFVFDSYYTGLLGVYVFIFPLVVYIGQAIYESLPKNFLSGFLVFFIDVTFAISLNWLANIFVGQVEPSASIFLVNALAPTLALNLFFFAICYFPIESLYARHRR